MRCSLEVQYLRHLKIEEISSLKSLECDMKMYLIAFLTDPGGFCQVHTNYIDSSQWEGTPVPLPTGPCMLSLMEN